MNTCLCVMTVRCHPQLSSFSRAFTAYSGREGVKGRRTLFLNVVSGALRF